MSRPLRPLAGPFLVTVGLVVAFRLGECVERRLPAPPPPTKRAEAAPAAPESAVESLAPAAPTIRAKELWERLQGPHPPRVCFVSPFADIFKEKRIRGAIWVSVFKVEEYFAQTPRDTPIVFYCGCCRGPTEGLSGQAVGILQKMGFTDVCHLLGHLDAWETAGFEVDRSPIQEGPSLPPAR